MTTNYSDYLDTSSLSPLLAYFNCFMLSNIEICGHLNIVEYHAKRQCSR